MSERDQYPPGVPCWIESLQPDPAVAKDFYTSLFDWSYAGPGSMAGDPRREYFVARQRERDVAGIAPMPPNAPTAPPAWITHVAVEHVETAMEAAQRAGGTVLEGPIEASPAGRLGVIADPQGAVLCVWQAERRQGAEIVNEPSAWAMSQLITPDPEAAAAFYEEVFGWQREPMSMGEAEVSLWRLPGYVGGEPQQPVPRDVVAVMARSPEPAGGAHWAVDVWVKDADATATRAVELGGRIVHGPYDSPGFRSAVIADPAGAVLSISALRFDH